MQNSFFKHKYLTMPTITPADALIKAADTLTDTILGNFPINTMTAQAVEQLMDTFKVQAEKATCEADSSRTSTSSKGVSRSTKGD